ncbi:IS1 family transposase [Escherichia coli]|uniref:IS1 family transposase n=1 Tax=Escherichia coli TaxID=562 RepID=UPI002168E4DB
MRRLRVLSGLQIPAPSVGRIRRLRRIRQQCRLPVARLGRKSLSFSKSVELHDKVIGHYLNIKHYQ